MESLEITILGQRYMIRGEKSKAELMELASQVDAKIREAYLRTPNSTPLKAAILVSLSMADELQRLRNEHAAAAESIRSLADTADTLISLID